jgi:hypothetical protein
MAVTIIHEAGSPTANSYNSEAEMTAYMATRLPLVPPWSAAADPTAVMVMATRLLDSMAVARRVLRFDRATPYYVTSRALTGTIATDTQALAFPRIGMYDRLGRLIPSNVIPVELREAHAELSGQLLAADRTLDNAADAAGIEAVKAGSVEVKFRAYIEARVLPDAVWALMPDSWFTAEIYSPARQATFRALG